LRYTWCGWLSSGDVNALSDDNWNALDSAWETDGFHRLERKFVDDKILLTFSTRPNVTPVLLAARAKGRLEHALRNSHDTSVAFSRKVAVRSIGENTTDDVEKYIHSQVRTEEFDDPRFAELLQRFTVEDSSVDLSVPSESRSGRYWYNLHIVLVTDGRWRIVDEASLRTIRDGSLRIAAKKGYAVSALSVMPDHLHLALRGAIDDSPADIALAFQNNLAYMLRKGAIWRPGFYVGTFGEYNMNAVRQAVLVEAHSPARQAGRGRD
jgi:REP element-mobilizing transposase RayT